MEPICFAWYTRIAPVSTPPLSILFASPWLLQCTTWCDVPFNETGTELGVKTPSSPMKETSHFSEKQTENRVAATSL